MGAVMKEKELRELTTCAVCGNKILACGVPMFYRVTIERFGLNMPALQRQQGLGLMLGGPLAAIMGPDEDLAIPMMDPKKIAICEGCNLTPVMLAQLADD